MRQLLNSASWRRVCFCTLFDIRHYFLCEQPCMPTPQSLCPVENAGRARTGNSMHLTPTAGTLPPPPHFPSPGSLGGRLIKLKSSFLLNEELSVWTEIASYRAGPVGTFCINDLVCRNILKTTAFITARSQGYICMESAFATFLPYLFSRLLSARSCLFFN